MIWRTPNAVGKLTRRTPKVDRTTSFASPRVPRSSRATIKSASQAAPSCNDGPFGSELTTKMTSTGSCDKNGLNSMAEQLRKPPNVAGSTDVSSGDSFSSQVRLVGGESWLGWRVLLIDGETLWGTSGTASIVMLSADELGNVRTETMRGFTVAEMEGADNHHQLSKTHFAQKISRRRHEDRRRDREPAIAGGNPSQPRHSADNPPRDLKDVAEHRIEAPPLTGLAAIEGYAVNVLVHAHEGETKLRLSRIALSVEIDQWTADSPAHE
jgi:hypothetical protein